MVAQSTNYVRPFYIVTMLYFFFGFVTNLNMALVPYLRSALDLPYGLAMLSASAFFLAYFVFSVPTARLIEFIGYKHTMVFSLFLQALGALLFIPAAELFNFPLFLCASFVLGAGVAALQTSANPYVSVLGDERSAPARLTLAQAANSFGGMLAPLVAGASILTDSAPDPYLLVALMLTVLGIVVAFSNLPAISLSELSVQVGHAESNASIWQHKNTVLAALGIFFYVGVEVGLASIMVSYFKEHGLATESAASSLISFYWGLALVGRLLGAWMVSQVSSSRLLLIFSSCATGLVFLSMISSGPVAIWSLIFCGFFNSIMFPTLFTLGIAGLGTLTSRGSGLMMTAIVGGAIIPFLFGIVADGIGLQSALIMPIGCYLYIAVYASHSRRNSLS